MGSSAHRVFSSCSCLGSSDTLIFAWVSSLAAATATAAHSRASTSCLAMVTDFEKCAVCVPMAERAQLDSA